MNKKLAALKKNLLAKDYKEWIWIGALLAAFFAYAGFIMLQSPNTIYSRVVEYTDSSVFQYIGKGILDGMVPYRDAFDHKGPILYLLNGAEVAGVGRMQFNTERSRYNLAQYGIWNNRNFEGMKVVISTIMSGVS